MQRALGAPTEGGNRHGLSSLARTSDQSSLGPIQRPCLSPPPFLEPLRGVLAVRSRSSDFLLRFEFWKSRNRLGFAPHRLFRRRGPSLERRYHRSSLFVEGSRRPCVLRQLEPDLDITSRSRRSRQPKLHTRFRNVLAGQFGLPFSLP